MYYMFRNTLWAACAIMALSDFPLSAGAAAPGPRQAMAPEDAFAYAENLAAEGDVKAMLAMGDFYERGIGTYRDYTRALAWYRQAADAGSPEGIYNVAVCLEVGMGAATDRAKAVEGFVRAADLGLAQAQYKLSALYADGEGVPRDEAKAVEYLAKAADAGHAVAANDLGVIFLHGLLGQKQDGSEALKRFLQAAEQGNLEAVKNIAVIFRDGLGQPANAATALKWFLIAQKGGYPAPDLPEVIASLQRGLKPDLVSFAEGQADQWIAGFRKKLAAQEPR
jgi:TPR repeat protein